MFAGGLFVLIGLALVAVWVLTLVNIIRTPEGSFRVGSQIMWVLIVVLVPIIGVPLYWVMAAPQRGQSSL
jgi:Phospholipase_D-nuclease N-terminal